MFFLKAAGRKVLIPTHTLLCSEVASLGQAQGFGAGEASRERSGSEMSPAFVIVISLVPTWSASASTTPGPKGVCCRSRLVAKPVTVVAEPPVTVRGRSFVVVHQTVLSDESQRKRAT